MNGPRPADDRPGLGPEAAIGGIGGIGGIGAIGAIGASGARGEVDSPGRVGAGGTRPPRTIRLDLEFDGEAFEGWQFQPRGRSVQGVVEETLARILGAPHRVVGAGRTDAGVHAAGMVASFPTASTLSAEKIGRALEALLPDDVGLLAATEAAPEFHALRDARWKWYRYTLHPSRSRRVASRRTAWRVHYVLDIDAMGRAASALVGAKDFAAMQASGSPRRSTVRRVAAVRLVSEPPLVRIDVVADGFLYGMVRCMAGTLVDVGRGSRDPASMEALLATRDRRLAGAAAPAHGLCLVAVGFAGDEPPPFIDPSLKSLLESASGAPDEVAADRSPACPGS